MIFQPYARNRSAEIFLLGAESDVCMTYEMILDDRVDGDALQYALDQALRRLPLMGAAIVLRDGALWYGKNDLPLKILERKVQPVIGGNETNGHLIAVCWHDQTISFTVHHAITDGVGSIRFLETLLYYYYCRLDGKSYPSDGIYVNDAQNHPALWADPFEKPFPIEEGEGKADDGGRITDGLELPENRDKSCHIRYCIETDAEEFMRFVKNMNTTPSAASALMMMHGIRKLMPDDPRPVIAKLPVDMRDRLGFQETMRNCVVMKPLRYLPEEMDSLSFAQQAEGLRETLRKETTEEEIRKTANGYMGFMHAIGAQGTIKKKRTLLREGRRPDQTTFLLSYIRGYRMNGYAEHLKGIRTSLLEPFPKLNITALEKTFVFELLQSFPERRYMEAFADQMRAHGFAVEITEERFELAKADLSCIFGQE